MAAGMKGAHDSHTWAPILARIAATLTIGG
jgi:hypothetical protein